MRPTPAYSRIAQLYDLLDLPFEVLRYRRLRRIVFAGVEGRTLDAGVGTGRNMPFYPREAEVLGIDASPQMLTRAEARRRRLGVSAELRRMDVTALAFPDGSFDYIIATFLFCVLSERNQRPALEELARVCKPDGEIRLLDYVYSRRPARRFLMRLWAPLVRRLYDAAFDRDPQRYFAAAGLELVEERFLLADSIKLYSLRPK